MKIKLIDALQKSGCELYIYLKFLKTNSYFSADIFFSIEVRGFRMILVKFVSLSEIDQLLGC